MERKKKQRGSWEKKIQIVRKKKIRFAGETSSCIEIRVEPEAESPVEMCVPLEEKKEEKEESSTEKKKRGRPPDKRKAELRVHLLKCVTLNKVVSRLLEVEREIRGLGDWIGKYKHLIVPQLLGEVELVCNLGSKALVSNVNNIRLHQKSLLHVYD